MADCGIPQKVDHTADMTVLQLPKFTAEATETYGIEALAIYLVPGSGCAQKLRWAAKGKGKRGGVRIIYLYLVIAARVKGAQ